jgi:HD-GYP domain-containing protein (c-di-GMP phosphodiesterase class II)
MDAVVNPLQPKRAQKGLTVRRQGEYLEVVHSKVTDICLLTTHQQVEVIEIYLKPEARLTLVPSGEAVETYYVLAGSLTCTTSSERSTLKSGDHIIAQHLEEPVILYAQSEARVLYVTSQPQFHEVSSKVSQLKALAVEVETKDGYTADHCVRLQTLSYATGLELGLSTSRLRLLDQGAYLHDVGKISIPLEILQKPSSLTPSEWEIVKRHPIAGRELLDNTFMKEAGRIVEQHHERLDGSGYPYGLAGDEVLIEAAIVAVADTYDAMTTDRPYRRALPPEEALAEIERHAGVHYPREVVRAFLAIVRGLKNR